MAKKANKRPNGEGSISKRKDGRYRGTATIGRDPLTGKLKFKDVYGKTKAEAAAKLRELCVLVENDEYSEPTKMTVGTWLDTWLSEYTNNIKELTKVTYETQVRVHIKPTLGKMPLAGLKAHSIQALYNQLFKGKDEMPGLSPKTIKNVNGVLHRALDQAVTLGYIKTNPYNGVVLHRIERGGVQPLTDDELNKFFSACKGNPYAKLFFVDIFTGMRQSEIMGLTWDCIDFTKNTIYINKQLIREKKQNGIFKFAALKNDKPRSIRTPLAVMNVLSARKQEQQENKLFVGDAWQDTMNLVFTDPLGKHYSHNTLSHNFKRITESIGLEGRRFHDMRHTYAVTALQSGVDVKTVQDNLGHHTAAFTLDVYGHVTEKMKTEAAERMDRFITGLKCDF